SALQTALGNPALTTGSRLTVPASLSYPVNQSSSANAAVLSTTLTSTSTVPAYYRIKTGDTWAGITQAVYGTNVAAAVSALQTALGNPTLTVGSKLTGLPTSLSYLESLVDSTDLTDPLGNVTSFEFNEQRQLIRIQAPEILDSVEGFFVRASVSYTYDAQGNVLTQTDGRGNVTTYQYDSQGNLTLQRDAAGNTVARTYGANNELLSQTVYFSPDPDGAGTATASQPAVTRYIYDSAVRLRFEISAEGRVTEHRYNGFGQRTASLSYTQDLYTTAGSSSEAQLASWAGTLSDKTRASRVDYQYDGRGQVTSTTSYSRLNTDGSGDATTASTKNYIYNAWGQLLQAVTPNGVATTTNPNDGRSVYTYDGLGRLLSSTDASGAVTLTQYDAANRRISTTQANGLILTRVYNAAGEVLSQLQSNATATLGTTQYAYDAAGRVRMSTDPTGVRSYVLYDDVGRKVADIEADGSLTEYFYNANHQLVSRRRYAQALPASDLAKLVDAQGRPTNVTLTDSTSGVAASDPAYLIRPDNYYSATTAPTDVIWRVYYHRTWNLYDRAGRLAKTVDEQGFVTEMQYDGASRLVGTVRYATALSAAQQALISADTLPSDAAVSVTPNAAQDRRTREFYDADGLLRGSLDAEGYVVEYRYNAAGQRISTLAYADLTQEAQRANGGLQTLIDTRGTTERARDIQTWTWYDAQGRVLAQIDGEGYLTEHSYDASGNKTRTIQYANPALLAPGAITTSTLLGAVRPATQARDQISTWTYTELNQVQTETNVQGTVTRYTYDNVGQLTRTERAFGSSEARTIQARYDLQGRLTGELTAEGSVALAALGGSPTASQINAIWTQYGLTHTYDAAGRRTATSDQNGHKTLFFYNTDGNLTHAINALGEVTETRYNALNQVTDTLVYGTRLSATTLATLSGGLVNPALTTALVGIANGALDRRTQYTYTQRGQLASSTDALGAVMTQSYNAFGEIALQIASTAGKHTTSTAYTYNRRGDLTRTTFDSSPLNLVTQAIYDAFAPVMQLLDTYRKTGTAINNGTLWQGLQDGLNAINFIIEAVQNASSTSTSSTRAAYDAALDRLLLLQAHFVDASSLALHEVSINANTVNRITQVVYDSFIWVFQLLENHGQPGSIVNNGTPDITQSVYVNGFNSASFYTVMGYAPPATTRINDSALNLISQSVYDAFGRVTQTTDANNRIRRQSYDRAGRVIQLTDALGQTEVMTYDAFDRVLTR
ncbi:MAG: RHS repeat protein, partial [Burkholderiales bacterium]|nr:RHS repeat protein [Burkholderiales bacterium]